MASWRFCLLKIATDRQLPYGQCRIDEKINVKCFKRSRHQASFLDLSDAFWNQKFESWIVYVVNLLPLRKVLDPARVKAEKLSEGSQFTTSCCVVEQEPLWELGTEKMSQIFGTAKLFQVLGNADFCVPKLFFRFYDELATVFTFVLAGACLTLIVSYCGFKKGRIYIRSFENFISKLSASFFQVVLLVIQFRIKKSRS